MSSLKMISSNQNILVVDSDRILLDSVVGFLASEGFQTAGVETLKAAMAELQKQSYSLVITELNLNDGSGFDILHTINASFPQTVMIMITSYGTIESAVKAIKLGAYDYLTKPINDDELRLTIERAIKQQSLLTENEILKLQLERKFSLENIISHDYKMAKIFDLVESVADSKTTILMTGPSGTGKSILARAIHYRSSRRNKPFVEVSCGALPESLLESELFGHVKGAFTGAIRDKEGKFPAADNGTIFLDEIANAPPLLQVKLLRILQEKQFEPVGSNKTETVDTRVILASNQSLEEKLRQGDFREDLYYRINVIKIELPPLSERVGDISLLANHFLKLYNRGHNREKLGITDEALASLDRYHWPGNVRELENVIERAVLLSKNKFITEEDLPPSVRDNHNPPANKYTPVGLKKAMQRPEKEIIQRALKSNHWNRQATAKELQINRTTLFKKMKQYGLYEEAKRLGLA